MKTQERPEESLDRRLACVMRANRSVRDPLRDPRNHSRWLAPLQAWQSRRLAASFADLSARPDAASAMAFFLSDVYGVQDVNARDRGVERVMPAMRRVLPPQVLAVAADAIELAALSHALDLRMAGALEDISPGGRASMNRIDEGIYGRAYRRTGLPRLRARQIALTVRIGLVLGGVVKQRWVARVLRLSRLPARAAGVSALQSFLERGFSAFAQLRDVPGFMALIDARERETSRRLFAGADAPFDVVHDAVAMQRLQPSSRSR